MGFSYFIIGAEKFGDQLTEIRGEVEALENKEQKLLTELHNVREEKTLLEKLLAVRDDQLENHKQEKEQLVFQISCLKGDVEDLKHRVSVSSHPAAVIERHSSPLLSSASFSC